jgi:long-chain acyl-CoA synthetase
VNAYAEGLNTLMDNIAEVKPTILVAVPRIFEKVYGAFTSRFNSGPPHMRLMGSWALTVGLEYSRALQGGRKPGPLLRAQYQAADRLVFKRVRERFGDRLRFTISGGAPLAREIAELCHACGLLVLEGYGLTETTGPVCVNRLHEYRFGTVGKVLGGSEIKIAEDGEILIKGAEVFRGYFGNPLETKLAFTEDGFFRSGDIGNIDTEGFLTITDRKKDILITAGGKNISPQKIENLIKSDPLFTQALVVGDKRKYLAALVTINLEEARRMAKSAGIESRASEALLGSTRFEELSRKRMDALNRRLAAYENIKRFKILAREFTVEAGELTPSSKVKRKFCTQKYADVIEDLYR